MSRKTIADIAYLNKLPDVNDEILQLAGITKEDRAHLLRRVWDKVSKRLGATTVKVFQHEGHVIYSDPLVDHKTQGDAIEQAKDLIGLRKDVTPRIVINAQVNLPSFAFGKREPKDVTPKDIEHDTGKTGERG